MDVITTENIETFRGGLSLKHGDLSCEIWEIFDRNAFDTGHDAHIVSVHKLVSTKNQLLDQKFLSGEKPDPRQTAFTLMKNAALGLNSKRKPLSVCRDMNGAYEVIDGNATAQVLMFVGWNEVPVEVIENFCATGV